MEKTQYLAHLDTGITPGALRPSALHSGATASNWRDQLPEMIGRGVTLRELRLSDAASLCELLTRPEVARFISQPPASVAGFEGFIL
jgi:hypothetical protein